MGNEFVFPYGKVIFGILCIIVLFTSTYVIDSGERGVLVTVGKVSDVPIDAGLHFKWPFVQHIVKIDVRTQKDVASVSAASNDLQNVKTEVSVNYYPEPSSVVVLYTKVGLDFNNRIIAPAVQEAVKASTATFTAEELITRRPEVKEKITQALTDRLALHDIVVTEVSLTDFEFSEVFDQAVEAKVTAEQNALAAKNKLEQVKYEKEQEIVAAQGKAEAQKYQIDSLKTNGGAEYVQLQAINKWDGKLPIVVGAGSMPFINIPNMPSGIQNYSLNTTK